MLGSGDEVRIGRSRLVVRAGATASLYDRFAIYDVDNRRLELADQAIRRGAVSIADLRRPPPAGTA